MVGLRLDKAVSLIPEIGTRSRAESLIDDDRVLVNRKQMKSSYALRESDVLEIAIPEPESSEIRPYDLKLDVLFEDSDIIVINKPPGLVVHPAAGHSQDTLVNALVHHTEDLAMKFGEERPGIVHRLDKDTSGILVVAKNDFAQENLANQFRARSVHRIYYAMGLGFLSRPQGTIQSYLARHPNDRKKYASVLGEDRKIIRSKEDEPPMGKWAVTHYQVLKTHPAGLSYIQLKLETGRTHQIRVHLSESNSPIIADQTYGSDRKIKSIHGSHNQQIIKQAPRCALHAAELGFEHPKTGEKIFFARDWPDLNEVRAHFFPEIKHENR